MAAVQQLLLSTLPSTAGIAFRSAGTLASGTGTITPGLPAGLVQNDFLLYVVASGNGSPATPTGFTATNANTVSGLFVFYKVAGASESAQSISTSGAGSTGTVAQMFAYSGSNSVTPLDVQMGADNATLSTSSVTTTAANDFVISMFCSTTTPNTWTAPANTNVRATNNPNSPLKGLLVVDELQVTAGASTVRTASGVTANFAFALAIKK